MAGRAGVILALLASAPALAATTGAALQQELDGAGPAALIAAHFQPDTGDGYAAVESGDAAAVAVGAALLRSPAADGAVTLSLRSALATALQAHPEAVLPLVDTHPALGADAICVPYLPFEPAEKLRAMLDGTKAALDAPAAAPFAHQAGACRKVLARAYASLRKAGRRQAGGPR